MAESWKPTWQLVLDAAGRLAAANGDFRLQELVAEVQRIDPARGRGTIQPTVQGMTVNAGTGPSSPCRKPLRRTGHGWYTLADGHARPVPVGDPHPRPVTVASAAGTSHGRTSRDASVAARVDGVIANFADCVSAYDRLVPFVRVGQYETHRATIDARRRLTTVGNALENDEFLGLL